MYFTKGCMEVFKYEVILIHSKIGLVYEVVEDRGINAYKVITSVFVDFWKEKSGQVSAWEEEAGESKLVLELQVYLIVQNESSI